MALHFMYYIFVRVHQTLRMTPAMAAGVTKRFWEIGDGCIGDVGAIMRRFRKAYQHFYDLIYTTDKGMRPCESAGK
jgi:hypothetical protein